MDFFADYINTTWVWWTISVIYALVTIGIICVVVGENRNPVKSLAWVTVLLVTPGIGLVFYAVFGRNIKNKHIISRRNRRKLRRLSPPRPPGGQGSNTSSPLGSQIVRLATAISSFPYYEGNTAEVYDTGRDKFRAFLADIATARQYVNLEYYIVSDDSTGRAVADALIDRARAGVRVRLVYDHVGSFKTPARFFRRLKEAGVEVHPFFRVIFPFLGTRVNWRNHRKICIIDGRVGYIGGMNIADRYVSGGSFPMWRDLHLRLTGPAVVSLQQAFAVDWNFMGNSLLEEGAPAPDPAEAAGGGEAPGRRLSRPPTMGMQLVTGGPTDQWVNLTLIFQKAISMARKCVYIQTPYFLPTEGLLHALQTAALAKIDVRIMVPRRSDSDMLRWASFSYIAECLRSGIKIYLYQKGMLHSKAVIIDDDFATVGSANFDFRSFEHNFEANMLVYSTDFNLRLKQIFLRDQRDSLRVNAARWRQRPMAERALESFMRLFAPIL